MFDAQGLKDLLGNMQKSVNDLEEKTKSNIYTAKSAGGLVSVTMNGAGELIDLSIDDSLLEDKESLQILLMSALNDVYKSVDEGRKSMAMNLFGDVKLF
ncbi:YbaB/EbfC family nucleoid-associated protein [Helicobacter anatolicus]|uniref:YbaB/EbfC family nucleoid-associated protein n=1 Tax=Helicobacter anatolicus TaxID=2905874 RepID=UPI001E61E8E7|nr:YbaB/EbfC family nucleoid-associated protein [Helicobacter anatolicus]MCE3039344.1 YbaB/EbfC family nucleoid-associated protein [Helicobacter anatolicus]